LNVPNNTPADELAALYRLQLEMALKGCVSGNLTEWPALIGAIVWALAEIERLTKERDALRQSLRSQERSGDCSICGVVYDDIALIGLGLEDDWRDTSQDTLSELVYYLRMEKEVITKQRDAALCDLRQELLVSDRLRISWREDVEIERKKLQLITEQADSRERERDELRRERDALLDALHQIDGAMREGLLVSAPGLIPWRLQRLNTVLSQARAAMAREKGGEETAK